MAPATEALGELLSHRGLQACRRDYERAVTSVASDRAQAIASASSALESICQAILSRLGQPVPKDVSIQNLIDKTMQALHLAPEAEAAGQIKRIFAAVRDIAAGVAVLRTKYGSAHGRNDDHTPLAPVHARLAINAMAAIGMFLLESVLDGPEDQSPGRSPSRTRKRLPSGDGSPHGAALSPHGCVRPAPLRGEHPSPSAGRDIIPAFPRSPHV